MEQPIELRKVRDFGQVINDTFTFLKQNFKPLLIPILAICGFFIMIEIISSIFTYTKLSPMFDTTLIQNPNSDAPLYTWGVLIDGLAALITQVFVSMITLCYMSVYIQKNNATPTLNEVWAYFKYYFFRVMGSGILIFLMLIVGFILCFLPGIYLLVPFYLILPIIIVENSSFSYAFNKSFMLVKDNWWFTFGIIIIMGLIVSVTNSIASIPLTVISAGGALLSLKTLVLPLVVIFSVLKGFLMLGGTLSTIAVCLCYFNLVEQKQGTGLLGRIDQFGKADADDTNKPAEEY